MKKLKAEGRRKKVEDTAANVARISTFCLLPSAFCLEHSQGGQR
jgi:hypothetical protein